MFSGKEIRVEMLAKKYMVAELVDWFGNAIEFKNETDETVVPFTTPLSAVILTVPSPMFFTEILYIVPLNFLVILNSDIPFEIHGSIISPSKSGRMPKRYCDTV